LVTENEMQGFQHLAESLPCIAWTADAVGEVIWYNQDFYKYSGLTPQWIAARSWLSIVHPEDRQEITRAYTHAIANGTILNSTVRLCSAEGTYRWFSARARQLNRVPAQWVGTLTDIHDQQTSSLANAHVVDALMKGYLVAEFPVSKNVRFDALYSPANDVEKLGGDWYDVFPLPEGRFGFSIGDVCGHGIDASVKMGEAKQAIFVAASLEDSVPENVLRKANDVLFLRKDHILTTALYGIVRYSLRLAKKR
jgi:PAS domain S-box-containing protein